MPRAGSTLLEQILSSHSQVEGTQELANVPRAVLDLQGYNPYLNNPSYPSCLMAISADVVRAPRKQPLAENPANRMLTTKSPTRIDKYARTTGLLRGLMQNRND